MRVCVCVTAYVCVCMCVCVCVCVWVGGWVGGWVKKKESDYLLTADEDFLSKAPVLNCSVYFLV